MNATKKKFLYDKCYNQKYIKQIKLNFNMKNENDRNLFEWLMQHQNKTELIKSILHDIKDSKK